MDIIYSLITVIIGMIIGFLYASLLNSKLKGLKYFFAALGIILLVIPTLFIALYCGTKVNGLFFTILCPTIAIIVYVLGIFYGMFIKNFPKTTGNTDKNKKTKKIEIYSSLFIVFVPLCLWIYSDIYYNLNAYNALSFATIIFFVILIIMIISVKVYTFIKTFFH